MKKERRAKLFHLLLGITGLVFLFLIWAFASFLMHQQGNFLLPYPNEVAVSLAQVLFSQDYAAYTWSAIGWTLLRLAIGFSVSFLMGAVLGTIAGLKKGFRSFMAPFIGFSKAMPTAAIVIILIGVFVSFRGLSPFIPCFLVFLVAFPLVYEAFLTGMESESQDVKDALSLDVGLNTVRGVIEVRWPDSQNFILLAIAQSLGLSMKVSVMSEILVNSSTSQGGIGGCIQYARNYVDMKQVIAYSIVAILLVLALDIPLFFLKRSLSSKED